jgi:protein-disulfide isomerase
MKTIPAIFLFSLSFAAVDPALAQSLTPPSSTIATHKGSPANQAVPNRASVEKMLPTKNEVQAALKRVFGYDPTTTWEIFDVRPSGIPGLADILVSINRQDPVHIFYSAETQNAIPGQMMPFGANPYASIRIKLKAADGPAQGPQVPVITVVEFSDLECRHCKAARPAINKLVTDFPQVRFVFQQFPLPASMYPWAMKAAEYTDCAQQLNPGLFWKYLDAVFENQGNIANATADDKLRELATQAGMNAETISGCAAQPQTEARVKKSMVLGQSLDVTQTPTLFINGRRVLDPASIPYDQIKNLMQFEIDHAGR